MELKTLWLGLLVSTLAFGAKAGLGWGRLRLLAPKGRIGVFAASLPLFSLLYLLVFLAILAIVDRMDLPARYEELAPLWEGGGVTLHWLAAALLLLWGVILLRRDPSLSPGEGPPARSRLCLLIPCPSCLGVILMTLGGLVLYFPEGALPAAGILYLAFMAAALGAGLSVVPGGPGDLIPRSTPWASSCSSRRRTSSSRPWSCRSSGRWGGATAWPRT